uniref:Neuroparsin n=1 Tax=Carabus violaceus TaxID=41075 RepID=A0A7U3MC89_CARVO|nr:neuroparsin [Carabus violaceus]
MHATGLVYVATLAVITTTLYNLIEAKPLCEPCDNRLECDESPKEMCMFGEARNYCNRRTCAKGPGDRCGGMYHQYGICGEGLRCTSSLHEMGVNRCHGCSLLTLDCY